MAASARYTRQVRLPEIGEEGQARLCRAEVPLVARGYARSIEQAYLGLAGVRPVDGGGEAAPAELESLGIAHPAARDVAEGALAALLSMRAVLGVEGR